MPTPGLCRLGAWQPSPHSCPGRCCLLLAAHWAGGPRSLPPPSTPPGSGSSPPYPAVASASLPPRPVTAAPTTEGRAGLPTAALVGGGSATDGVVWSACEMALGASVRHAIQPRGGRPLGASLICCVPRSERPEPGAHLGMVQEPAVQHAAQRGDADGHHAGLGGRAGQGVVAHSLPDVAGEAHSERAGQDPGSCRHRGP